VLEKTLSMTDYLIESNYTVLTFEQFSIAINHKNFCTLLALTTASQPLIMPCDSNQLIDVEIKNLRKFI